MIYSAGQGLRGVCTHSSEVAVKITLDYLLKKGIYYKGKEFAFILEKISFKKGILAVRKRNRESQKLSSL